ncbi:hypothetical protein TSUD_332960 [Trifolium subterraneum]|uniref:Uncharacterized protein n=1 Tax=Trifolium subterraneum TaxID=3900 RepID=A0A2Z6N612_TRISU|nr:hypothetical protein TSUD_332960 [Trifolium subterraneum]
MSGPSSNDGGPGMNLQAAIGEINRLKAKMAALENEKAAEKEKETEEEPEEIQDSQPQAQALWDSQVPANFKIPQLPTFEGKTDPLEHLMAVGTQTAIIGAEEHLRCKLLSSTFKDAALRWYMNLPRNSISSCSDFHKKFVRQFAGSKHIQVTATSLFSIRQGASETLREYFARFSEATIKVSNPNQEMFVAAFQNGLKAGHFNESLAQKPAKSMQEIMKRAECYIKGEESNEEREGWHNRGGRTFRNSERRPRQAYEEYSPLNSAKVHVLHEILNTGLAKLPTAQEEHYGLGPNDGEWCHYHRCKGHDTEKCYKFRDLIEGLIRSGHLRKFIEKAAQVETTKQEDTETPLESPQDDKGKETARVAVNTIAGGFAGGGESNSARKRYLRGIIDATNNSNHARHAEFPATPDLSFPAGMPAASSLTTTIHWLFRAMKLSSEQLQPYHGTLVGFTGDQADVMGHITLLTTFGERDNAKTVKVRYLVVRTPFTSYNIIIGRPAFNALGAAMSTLYLSIKYPLDNGGVGILRGDQAVGRQCYESSLKIKKKLNQGSISQVPKEATDSTNMSQTADLDPREEFQEGRVSPTEELEEIKIGDKAHQVTNLGTTLPYEERGKIIATLRRNVDLFAWHPEDMPGIYEGIITHKLAIMPNFKPVSQKKRKLGEERREAVDEEVAKLKAAHFIEEIKYPEWLANVVMVKKNNGKWRMCVDFTDLNKACLKDPYPLPSIDKLIDGASGCKVLSFMDAYSGYNQIKMNLPDAPHAAFMTNNCNYFYKVMPFGLKNVGATYQRLMDRIFSRQIGRNLEVYIDDMVVKTTGETSHDMDLEEILAEVRRYNMRLNPAKCSFGVQAGKFLGFMLTSRRIEANPDKCQAIINMRSPTSVKEVQQLTGRIAALSRFLSCAGEKAFHFFSTLKKWERFTWTTQCEEVFHKLKEFLASPPILARSIQGIPLHLYLAVSENAMSSALVQEINGEERPIYFVSRTFRGAETRYQKIERLSLAVIFTARRLRQYFQSHKIVVKTDFPIKQVLKKPDLAGRMVAWSVELSEYDITFSPRGSIADFVLEMTTPPEMASTQPWTLSVDDASNLRGSGAGIILEGADGVSGEYQTKDPQLIRYLEKVRGLAEQFDNFELIHVPRDQNSRADLLSKLASTKKPGNNRTVIQETISKPNTEMAEVTLMVEQSDWRLPIIQYLKRDILPAEKEDAARIKKISPYYTLIGDKLYKRGFSSPLLLCVSTAEAQRILNEIHDGSCGNHIGARSLTGKVTRAGYFWPHSYTRPRSTYEAVTNARGPFTASQGQVKFLLVPVDYFTKWVEAEPVATIFSDKFTNEAVIQFCQEKGIKNTFVLVEHPQANGQAESANKVILRALKRKLARKEKSWSEHLPAILWSYHTTVHTSTGETPFKMVYGADAMIPVEINPPSWRRETLNAPDNETALKENLDLLEELREMAHFKEFAAKQRATRKYNTRVIPRSFKEGDLVLKRPMGKDKGGKLPPNWEGPFRIQEAFGGGAYRLETLKGETLPRTWNVANLKFYFS